MPTLIPRKLYVTCLNHLYPHNLRYPFGIIYLPNSCKASSDSFFLPSTDELTSKVGSRHLNITFLNFKKQYEKLNAFTLMQTFNLTPLSNEELEKTGFKNTGIKKVLFQYVNKVLLERDTTSPFVMPN